MCELLEKMQEASCDRLGFEIKRKKIVRVVREIVTKRVPVSYQIMLRR